MSIYKVTKNDLETFSIVTNPIRHYVSSSTAGSTGSVNVFARRSSIEKDATTDSSFVDAKHDDSDLNSNLQSIQLLGREVCYRNDPSLSAKFHGMLESYFDK